MNVPRAMSLLEDAQGRCVDPIRVLAHVERVAQEHPRGEDGRDGIGHTLPCNVGRGAMHGLAEGSMPMEPARMAASSERMSPKVFSVTMVSKCVGLCTRAMAQLSTSTCSSCTWGYSFPTRVTTSRQSCETTRTLALSTEARRFRRFMATSKATRATRSISRDV